ncbi:chemotaxis protein [Kitasatospora sp. RB6PN24]|uniref:baeRF3 domain-containing protein n=1 Tax=Kitasatospora humi TaxID=2893891 RepID=UPI001E523F73|nr:chemotaxis protein [Kitasatospora humi]MCC9308498.1 chemotaxis protein [Kitasatospora humi]
MDVTDLTPAILAALAGPRPRPAVTVAMPTHRQATGTEQDNLLLKNLLAEARRRIEGDDTLGRAERLDVLDQLDRAAGEADLRHAAQDGLLLFAAPGEHQMWRLPRTVPTRVVVSDTFLTRNLVAARAVYAPYWVLTLGAEQVRLWGGAGPDLAESTAGGFPVRPANPEKFDPQREEQIGDTKSVYSHEDTRIFYREVDAALDALLKEAPRPVHLVGVPEAVSLFESVTAHREVIVARLEKGGLGDGPATALAPALAVVRAEQARADREAALARLDQAAGRKTLAAGLDEIWVAVSEGRVGELVVEEHYQETVEVTDGHLAPAPAEGQATGSGEVREDVVDEIVERTLQAGGTVTFVPDETLTDRQSIAAVLRY